MANLLSGGAKSHMMKYKGVKIKNGIAFLIKSTGTGQKACGGRYKGTMEAADFSRYMKKYPGEMCKNCAKILDQFIKDASIIKSNTNCD